MGNNWVSVKDKLPNIGLAVLTIGLTENDEWTTPITAQLCDDGSGMLRFISGFSFGGSRLIRTMIETKATHWQHLPKPPKRMKYR